MPTAPHPTRRTRRFRPVALGATTLVAAALFIPDPVPRLPENPNRKPFHWQQDDRWDALEVLFTQARAAGCDKIRDPLRQAIQRGWQLAKVATSGPLAPRAPVLDTIEETIFMLGTVVGACRESLPEYIHLVTVLRADVKRQSEHWALNAQPERDRLYRILYGGRSAIEEVMLQGAADSVPARTDDTDEPSRTPGTMVLGVMVHSGDMLVSREGLAVDALIAVGSDYPGNFSHDALVYVDSATNLPSVIESSSGGGGVGVHTMQTYLEEHKFRVMVLRLRADLPALVNDPMLPHKAATGALAIATARRIPYNFAMDQRDHDRMYCSQLLAAAYAPFGITLWTNPSSISDTALTRWLSGLGIRYLEPEEPSDLEYDPQLHVVAEWRDPASLYDDHVNSVVTEAMLDGAQQGDPLVGSWYLLPVARLLKVYSTALNLVHATGPIPDGLGASAALRLHRFTVAHADIKRRVLEQAARFKMQQGYTPPEWVLLRMARQSKAELRPHGP